MLSILVAPHNVSTLKLIYSDLYLSLYRPPQKCRDHHENTRCGTSKILRDTNGELATAGARCHDSRWLPILANHQPRQIATMDSHAQD